MLGEPGAAAWPLAARSESWQRLCAQEPPLLRRPLWARVPLNAGTGDFLAQRGTSFRRLPSASHTQPAMSYEGREPEAGSLGFFENRHLLNRIGRGLGRVE